MQVHDALGIERLDSYLKPFITPYYFQWYGVIYFRKTLILRIKLLISSPFVVLILEKTTGKR